MERSTSSRTTLPKRRRRSSSSMASSRSSASSSSMERSALRVTRKRWCASDLHAREERVEVGGDDLLEQDVGARRHLPQARQDGRHLDAREAALAGARVAHRDRQRQRQVADVGEGVRGVDRERRQHREDLVHEPLPQLDAGAPGGPRSGRMRMPASASSVAMAVGERPEWCAWSCSTRARMRSSFSLAERPSGVGREWPAATCCLRPATRTWKNSSRLLAKMARKRTRSSSGLRSSSACVEDALVEVQPGELAVDEGHAGGARCAGATAAERAPAVVTVALMLAGGVRRRRRMPDASPVLMREPQAARSAGGPRPPGRGRPGAGARTCRSRVSCPSAQAGCSAYWPTSETSESVTCSSVRVGFESSQPGWPASPRQKAQGQSQRRVVKS